MTVKEIYNIINAFAPFDTGSEWDNSGILIGNENMPVSRVIVTLDVTDSVLEQAVKAGAQLIISHHPVIFKPLKALASDSICYKLAVSGIAVISAHTNLDKAVSGVNDTLCEALNMNYEKIPAPIADGFLNVGTIDGVHTAEETAGFIAQKLGAYVRFTGGETDIDRIAVCSGAGAEFIEDARKLNCNAFITGDASYHNFLEANELGITLFAAGHFETEVVIVPKLVKILTPLIPDAEIIPADRKNPIITVK